MSNYGLKSYCKGITNSICNVGNVTVSLCQNDANLIIELPLISTKGLVEFSTSLVFNLQCINTLSEFGNGFRLNYKNSLQLMYENNELVNVQVKNCDGSVDNHYLVDNYYNKETETTINIIERNNAIYYELVDKYGNKSKYSEFFLEYPYEIEMSTSEILDVDMRNNQDKISNRNGDEIRFIRNGSIEYYHNYELIERIQLNISNHKLIGLTRYKLEESYSCSIAYGYEDDELINIIVKDNITNYRVKYILDGNKVISYITGYDDLFTNGKITQITYVDNYKTIVTDEYLDSTAYYFDNNGLFLYSIGSNGYGYKEIYNNDSKKIEYQSEEISFKGRLNNLLPSNDINCFTRSEVTISSVYNDDISLQDALGNSVRRVIGTGTLKYTLLVDGLSTDNISLVMFARQNNVKTDTTYTKIKLTCDETCERSLNKEVIDNKYEMIVLGLQAKYCYSKIIVEITVHNDTVDIGGVQLLKKDFGSFYEYDSNGNLHSRITGSGTIDKEYNSHNLEKVSISKHSVFSKKTYTAHNRYDEIVGAYNVKTKNTYDSNDNITQIETTSISQDKSLVQQKEYTSDGRFVEKEIDENNKCIQYTRDAFGKILTIKDALNRTKEIEYDEYDNITTQILKSNNTRIVGAEYTYTNDKLTKVEIENLTYEFVYINDNISEIKINNNVVYRYTYNNYDLVSRILYGTANTGYEFTYVMVGTQLKPKVERIYYIRNNVSSLRYTYIYNDFEQITQIKDANNNILINYEYDNDGYVIEKSGSDYSIGYTYDNLKNNNSNMRNISSKKIYSEYNTVERSKGNHPEAVLGYICNETYFVSGIYNEQNTNIYNLSSGFQSIFEEEYTYGYDGTIPYLDLVGNKKLAYNLQTLTIPSYPFESGCVGFWFKANSITGGIRYLFSNKNSNNNSFIGVYINEMGYVKLTVTNPLGSTLELICSDSTIKIGWNFFMLSFIVRDDGLGYESITEYALMLNGKIKIVPKPPQTLWHMAFASPIYNIGYKLSVVEGEWAFGDYLNMPITAISIGRWYKRLDEMTKYYKITRDYIIENIVIDDNIKTVDFSSSNIYYNQFLLNNYDIFPLHNSVNSINGTKPLKFNIRATSKYDKDRTFNYNKDIKNYAYVADGAMLSYKLNDVLSGTIFLKAFMDSIFECQYILDMYDTNEKNIAIYLNSESKIVLNVFGNEISTNFYFTKNVWHAVCFSYQVYRNSSNYLINYSIFVDNNLYQNNHIISVPPTAFELYVGRKKNGSSSLYNLGGVNNCFPLWGQIENLLYKPSNITSSEYQNIISSLNGINKAIEYDDLGRIRKESLSSAAYKIINYKNISDSQTTILISNEKYHFMGEQSERTYSYDDVGNVIKIQDSTFGNREYMYNDKYYLSTEKIKKYNGSVLTKNYTYDSNGNILSDGTNTFTYDSNYKRLSYVNSNNIYYQSSNPLYPAVYNNKTFTYEGKCLTKVEIVVDFGTFQEIEYKYDDEGHIIRKEWCEWYDDYREAMYESTIFIYSGDLLVAEIKDNVRNDYLYDENNMLFGFIQNNTNIYYYVRDSLNNIIGLTNINGNLITKYNYDAYGNIIEYSGTNIYNSFRYKGYYYDNDIGMYYCLSRFYVPEWHRWLTPDSPHYLDCENITELNLFMYCNNNPVNGMDPTGHFAITLTTLLIGGLIAGGLGAGIGFGTAVYKDYKEDGILFNDDWTDYVGRTLGGFVTGFGLGIAGVLGAGVGAAALGGTTATLFTTSGMSLSIGSALAIGSGTAFVTGMAGYTTRTLISRSEDYNIGNMFIEGGINAVSGALSVVGGALGGYAGLHNTVFTKLLSQRGDFVSRLLVENMFTGGFKMSLAVLKMLLEG